MTAWSGRVWRDATGAIVVRTQLSPSSRLRLERQLLPGVSIDHQAWERAHTGTLQGDGHGTRYAPRELRRGIERLGLDRFLREAWDAVGTGVDLVLTTVLQAYPGTARLSDIRYRIEAVRGGERAALLDAALTIEDRRESPRVSVQVHQRTTRPQWTRLMTTPSRPLSG